MKSKLNKTIDFNIESESGKKYLKNCIIDNENIKEYSENEIKIVRAFQRIIQRRS